MLRRSRYRVEVMLLRTAPTPFAALVLLVLTGSLLAGCSPAPEPTPTPTAAFASEEEAFAAAEETYRDYTSALNQVDISNPDTFEPLFDLTSGDFEAADRETFSELHAADYELTGETRVASFRGVSSDKALQEITAIVCVDVSQSGVVDQSGQSKTAPDRPDMNALRVTFVLSGARMLIDHATREESNSCGSA